MENRFALNSLLEKQLHLKPKAMEVKELSSQYDLINLSIYELTIGLSSLLPEVGTQSFGGKKADKKKILSTCSKSMVALLELCGYCDFDIPDAEDFESYDESIPDEVKQDTTLSILDAISNVYTMASIIYVELKSPIWDEEEIPDDFYEASLAVVVNICNIAKKFGYTLEDILAAS